MSEGIFDRLREKFVGSRSAFENNMGGQCLQKALELYDSHRGGSLWWVGNLGKVGLDFGLHHTYFVPPKAKDSDRALNQADSGFPQYPALTVGEVKSIGQKQDINTVRGIVKGGKR